MTTGRESVSAEEERNCHPGFKLGTGNGLGNFGIGTALSFAARGGDSPACYNFIYENDLRVG